jgi:hypothetical protein
MPQTVEVTHPLWELLELPYWVSWKKRTIGQRTLKVPIGPNGEPARVNQPGWPFSEVPSPHGFILHPDHPYVVLDLDWKGSPQPPQWAQDLIQRLDTYTEISPSGQGAHLWLKISGPKPANQVLKSGPGQEVNLLAHHRYSTVTWEPLGPVRPIRELMAEEVERLLEAPDPLWEQVVSQSQLIQSLLRGEVPEQFRTLSQSELDWAVARELAHFTRDPEKIKILFHKIPLLAREKLHRDDYLARTISKALAGEERTIGNLRLVPAPKLLEASEAPRGIVSGLLPVGLTILAGRPKLGKTWLALQIARSVALGESLLGFFSVETGKVIYLALEDTPWRMGKRLEVWGSPPPNLYFSFDSVTLSQAEQLLEAERPLLLVIDTLLAATRASGDGVGRVKAEYDELLALEKAAVRQGSAVLIITHTAKAERSFSLDRVLGTTGVTAAVDSVITLLPTGDSGLVVLESKARDYPPMELNLRWADGWIVEGDKQSSHKARLLTLLDTGPKTTEDLSSVLGLSPRKVRKMLNEMVAEGTVRKTGIVYWRVAEVMEDDQDESSDR